MPLLYQKLIKRVHLRTNPEVLYIFGDNVKRTGLRGQAAEMRGEPNAVGVATKWEPTTYPEAYFNDDQIDEIREILRKDLDPAWQALKANKIVIWPVDGIGTGLSCLPKKAPKVWELLETARRTFEKL